MAHQEGITDLIYCSGHRFLRAVDGSVWSWYFDSDWYEARYGARFERILVLARSMATNTIPDNFRRSDSTRVLFPVNVYYRGPLGYLWARRAVSAVAERFGREKAAFLIRDEVLGFELARVLAARRFPYAVAMVGDTEELLGSGAIRDPLVGLSRTILGNRLRWMVGNAAATLYVTDHILQERYPCPGYTASASDVGLSPKDFAVQPRTEFRWPRRLVLVGSFDNWVKGADILLKAFAVCRSKGINLELTLVGGGTQLAQIKRLAHTLGVAQAVTLTGFVTSREMLRAQLDNSDLFVLPSRTEGTPRALLEAMARSLPCLASRVGGVPELLTEDCLVRPNSVRDLSEKIAALVSNADDLANKACRNLLTARLYSADLMNTRIDEFLDTLKAVTSARLQEEESR